MPRGGTSREGIGSEGPCREEGSEEGACCKEGIFCEEGGHREEAGAGEGGSARSALVATQAASPAGRVASCQVANR